MATHPRLTYLGAGQARASCIVELGLFCKWAIVGDMLWSCGRERGSQASFFLHQGGSALYAADSQAADKITLDE
jgi:hypothetical protein